MKKEALPMNGAGQAGEPIVRIRGLRKAFGSHVVLNGIDFEVLTTERLIFAPGETQKIIEINITGDEIREAKEAFQVKFYNPLNVKLTRDLATVTIEDDDAAPVAQGMHAEQLVRRGMTDREEGFEFRRHGLNKSGRKRSARRKITSRVIL